MRFMVRGTRALRGRRGDAMGAMEVSLSMMAIVYTISLVAVCAVAAWRGGTDERLAAGAMALAAMLSPFVEANGYSGPEAGLILVDVGLFVVLAGISLRSRAFWPMWAASNPAP